MALNETYSTTADNLFAANQVMPVVSDSMTIAKAGALVRGSLLTAAGALASSTDDVVAVLAEDVDTTSAAVVAPVYLTGEFNENALTVASGSTASACKASARKYGIFIKSSVTA